MAPTGWRSRLAIVGVGPLACAIAYGLGPGTSAGYLALQAASDPAHRFAIVAIPGGLLGTLLLAGVAWLLRAFDCRPSRGCLRFRAALRIGIGLAWAFSAGTGGYILRFDRTLEQNGLRGELLPSLEADLPAAAPGALLGPYPEEAVGPGVATDELPGGDHLTLDRKTLARKTPDGAFRWNRTRPGDWPASLTVSGNTALFAGPSGRYEDDAVLVAIDLESGRERWRYHCLGFVALPPALEDAEIALVAVRHSVSSLHLLRWTAPRLVWSIQLDRMPLASPRFTPRGIEVDLGTERLIVDRKVGSIERVLREAR